MFGKSSFMVLYLFNIVVERRANTKIFHCCSDVKIFICNMLALANQSGQTTGWDDGHGK